MALDVPVRMRMLRILLAMDATVLLATGALFMALPAKVGLAFGFPDLAPAVCYLIGLWGCALISLGVGYACSVGDPVRNVTWIRAGIVRGGLECAFGFVVLGGHMVTWNQAAFGTVIAGAIALGYMALYPREAA
jgi:hypothetical protein